MKVVILAGGYGTRISEESRVRPKPLVEIGHRPILWHIMKIYSSYGFHDFIICCGYKGYMIKQYFADYFMYSSDITFDIAANTMEVHHSRVDPWKVTLVDTGLKTMTGGRLKRVREYIGNETFCFTYGDGVSDVDLNRLIAFHREQDALVTLTAVQPPGRFGAFTLKEDQTRITQFREKIKGDGAWINGGFFVVEPEAIDYVAEDLTSWEREPMERLAREGKLSAYKHEGFWQSMDTLRDKIFLEDLWNTDNPPWKLWKD